MKREPYVSAWEEIELLTADLEKAQARNSALSDALHAVLSALEDVGMDHSRAHEIATAALKGAA